MVRIFLAYMYGKNICCDSYFKELGQEKVFEVKIMVWV